MGVGVGVGVGEVVVVEVDELMMKRGSVPVPRTQANGGVQVVLVEMLFPAASHEAFAAVTIERRRSFKPVCKDAVPWGVFAASADTAEHAGTAERKPSRP